MKEVNADLYEFLKENETGLYKDKSGEVIAYVHIGFSDLSDFVEIVGSYHFEEGGMDANFFQNSICVELNNVIDGEGHSLSAYKKCFNETDWKYYKNDIKANES